MPIEPVECKIFIAGRELTALYDSVEEVRVEMKRGAATTCTIVFDSVREVDGEWSVQDHHSLIRPWAELAIEAYFGSRAEPVMSGHVTEVRLEYPEEMSGAKVTVTGQDYSIRLDREHLREAFSASDNSLSDAEIARRLAERYKLRASTPDNGLQNAGLNLDDTAIKFLKARAEANGFELFVRGDTLHFHSIQLGGTPQPAILLYAGPATNCLSFNVVHTGHQPDQARATYAPEQGSEPREIVHAPNLPLLGQEATDSGRSGLATFVWNLSSPNGATEAELNSRAQAAANERSFKIEAEGELDGALYGHVLRNYETVEVDGAGSTYDGRYYVADVTHTFTSEGYRQRFKLLRNATGRTRAAGGGATDVLANARQR